MKLLKGKKAITFFCIFVFSLALVTVGIVFFVRTFCFYTVSFRTYCDIPVASYRVLRGFSGHDPNATLRKVGYYFDGWYIDQECTIPYDFGASVIDNITLHAKWSDANAVLLTYADNQAEEYLTQAQLDDYVNYLKPGSLSTVDIYTNNLGYTLVWFEDSDMSGKYYTEPTTFDLSNGDITLYGAWCDINENSFDVVQKDYCSKCGERELNQISNSKCTTCNNLISKANYITRYNGTCRNIIVPSTISGIPVKGTADGVMTDYVFRESTAYLSKIIIPDTFEKIGSYTFYNCKNLWFLRMPALKYINSNAFNSCTSITSFDFGQKLVNIGDYAFAYAFRLSSIDIPNTCVNIGGRAFIQTSITSLNIPGSVKTIGDLAFASCENLTELTLNDGIENIGQEAFGKTKLSSVHIPKSVTVLGYSNATTITERKVGSVFNFNSNLTQVTIDSDNPNFKAVNNIIYNKSADASKDMNTIYFYPRALTTTIFTIDDKVTTIENSAFIGASNLKEIVIGKSVTSIGPSAFKDCSGLEKISMAPNGTGSIRVYNDAFNNCESLFDVRLERLSVVGRAIFSSCKSLKQIKLNNGIRMDNGAFYNCQSLEKIVFIGSVAFSDDNYNRFLEKTSDNLTIYVPSTTYTLVVDTFTNIQGLSPYVGAIVSYTNIDECGLIDYDNV